MQKPSIEAQTPPRFGKGGVAPERLAEAKSRHAAAVREAQKENSKLAREHGAKYQALRDGDPKNGVDTATMGHLLGHEDASMVSRAYGKIQ